MFADDVEVPLRSGFALTGDEARRVLKEDHAILVLFAGAPKAGKTTMLSAIYETLLDGPLGDWQFAGSLTLLGFAMRSWYASTASGRTSPETERTRYDVTRPWLHLRLRHINEGRVRTLLIADLSGEFFQAVGAGGDLGDAADIVARADHVIHLVDAELFVAKKERLRALDASEAVIVRLTSTPHVGAHARHTIAIAKADVCPPEFHDRAIATAHGWAARWLNGAEVIEVAARPIDSSLPRGLEEVIDDILTGRRPQFGAVPIETVRHAVALLARGGVEMNWLVETEAGLA